MDYSIIIPCFQSAAVLPKVVAEITHVLAKGCYEIILVDDGNTQEEKRVLEALQLQFPCVIVKKLSHNRGQHAATQLGCLEASGDYIVTMDDDGQHDPNHIPRMKALLAQEASEIVYAYFAERKESSWKKAIRKCFFKDLKKSSFRIWHQHLNDARRNDFKQPTQLLDGVLSKSNPKISYLRVSQRASLLPRSRYSRKSYCIYFKEMLRS